MKSLLIVLSFMENNSTIRSGIWLSHYSVTSFYFVVHWIQGTHHNRSVVTGTSISSRNIPKGVPSTDNLVKKETLTSGPSSRELPTQKHNSSKNSVGGGSTDQKTLKVRIKVGNENALRRNNAEIYSGLGLDISPSSSLEASSGGSAGPSAESRGIPGESPQSILEVILFFLVL
jgi:hypothetical protein